MRGYVQGEVVSNKGVMRLDGEVNQHQFICASDHGLMSNRTMGFGSSIMRCIKSEPRSRPYSLVHARRRPYDSNLVPLSSQLRRVLKK